MFNLCLIFVKKFATFCINSVLLRTNGHLLLNCHRDNISTNFPVITLLKEIMSDSRSMSCYPPGQGPPHNTFEADTSPDQEGPNKGNEVSQDWRHLLDSVCSFKPQQDTAKRPPKRPAKDVAVHDSPVKKAK